MSHVASWKRVVGVVVLTVFLVGTGRGQGVVHVVDTNAGPGSDFTTIASAMSAAFAGDTLLIRAGNYDEFPTVTKGLTLQAELGAVVTVTDLSVRNLPAAESVMIRGITVTEGPGVTPGTFRVTNCQGPVWVEDCQFLSAPVPFQSGGVRVATSDEVIFTRCFVEEPDDSLTQIFYSFSSTDSNVFLYDTEVYGRDEGGGQDGGHGILVDGGYMAISGGVVTGGNGGDGFFFFCDGGDGGDAVILAGDDPELLLLGPTMTAGTGGLRDQPQCSDGIDGQLVRVNAGSFVQHTQTSPRRFSASSPVREGQLLTVTFDDLLTSADGGDLLWVMVSASSGSGIADAGNLFGGLLAVAPPRLFFLIGPTGGQGSITLSRTVPELGPGVEGGPVYLQGLFWDHSAGELVPMSPSAPVVLDSGF